MDPELYNLARPYACVECGRSMRTRGVDGRCIDCAVTPRVVCRGYETASGAVIRCGRVIQPGRGAEIAGQCVTCAGAQALAWAQRSARHARRVARQMAKGYGPDPQGRDPFRGMREDGDG
jgi:hypothetical protein